jgi:hypothetical protein
MLTRTMVLAGVLAAGTAGAASAATYVYDFEGSCVGSCATGASFDGDLILGDTSFSAGGAVSQDDFLGLALRFGRDNFIGNLQGGGLPAELSATWGDTAGQLGSFTYRASAALTPAVGFTVSANLTGDGGGAGGLAGSAIASLIGNCNALICDSPLLPSGSSYAATANLQLTPGPQPIPLPAPLLLLGAGLAALFGLRFRRSARAAA